MRIDRIELFHVAMPLLYPWRTAYGEDAAIHAVLCRMSSGSVDGWGESSPLAAPCYSAEWAGGAFATARDWLAPAVIGQDLVSGEALQQRMAIYKGNYFAKAALDAAWWSLHCNATGTALHKAIGAARDMVPVGADFGVMDSLDDLLQQVGQAIDAGFPRIKLKFRPGWDIPMLRAVRQQHPEHAFHIDCNSGYKLDDADLFRQVDDFNLAMIEQPLAHDDVHDHARLQSQIETAVCLDETIKEIRHARLAIELDACRYVNIKPGRVGGLTNAIAIHNFCQAAGIPCWVGGMLESSTGSAHCVALAMLDNFTYPADIFPTSRFYARYLSDPPLELETCDGVPSARAFQTLPEPVPERLAAHKVQQAVVTGK